MSFLTGDYWGEFWLAWTICWAIYPIIKGSRAEHLALIFVFLAWMATDQVNENLGRYNTFANITIDVIFLAVVYHYWYFEKTWIMGFLCWVTLIQMAQHGAQFVITDTNLYLPIRNILFGAQTPAIAWSARGNFLVFHR